MGSMTEDNSRNEVDREWLIKLIALLFVGVLWVSLAVMTYSTMLSFSALIGFIGLAILYRRLSKLLVHKKTAK